MQRGYPLRMEASNGRRVAPPEGDRRSWLGPSFELVESKLLPPSPRPGIVPRTALVDRLLALDAAPVVCVVAPAGYGKTTLLAQWAERKGPRVGWVSVDQHDNDPTVLLTYLAVAVDRVEPIDPSVFRTLAASRVSSPATVIPRLVAALSAMTQPVALVLDHVELLGYLAANGFRNYIASGGGRDFMRPISQELYGVPRQRVIGSSTSLAYQPDEVGGRIVRKPEADVLDDGPQKPVRIWSRVGRRPVLAAGNSNGDIPMLQFAAQPDRRCLRLLVLHDDADREFDYVVGAEQALQLASTRGWTVVSIKDDWATVF